MNKLGKKWEFISNQLIRLFLIKYFELKDGELNSDDYFWVNNEVGGICCYGDYYIAFSDILFCLNNNVPIDKFFEWYDLCLETENPINLNTFMMGPSKAKELEKKQLTELKLKLQQAAQELIEALKKYGNNNKK